jgi:hypothetical protein
MRIRIESDRDRLAFRCLIADGDALLSGGVVPLTSSSSPLRQLLQPIQMVL